MLKISNRIIIPAHEIEQQFIRSQGAGGQHVNKTKTYTCMAVSNPSYEARLKRQISRPRIKHDEIISQSMHFHKGKI